MTTNKLGAVMVALIAFALVVSVAAWSLTASVQQRSSSGSLATVNDNQSRANEQLGGLGFSSGAAVLHSVASIENRFNTTLILPSAAAVTALNPSLRLVGVGIDFSTANNWEVTIYYSNQTFVNGTTSINALVANSGLEIAENPAQPGVNSSAIAHRELMPPTETQCQQVNGSLQCTTITQSANANQYITTQNGLSLLVNPLGHDVVWTDDRVLMNVALGSGDDYTAVQLLPLAATMTANSISAK